MKRTQRLTGLLSAIAIGFALAWIGVLVLMFYTHNWILDVRGNPVVTDFLEVWIAGKTTLAGHAVQAYDPKLHYAAEAAAAGHAFHGHLWWHYPPMVLFLAAALAALPYLEAFLFWVCATAIMYGALVYAVVRSRLAPLAALGAPAVFLNAVCGQNGCFTAALYGGALLYFETRPIVAGICIGLLTYKPQLGVLFPVVLAASGRWRVFAVAGVVSLLGFIAPAGVFGPDILRVFAQYLPIAGETMLVNNPTGWSKLQSVYALIRFAGLGDSAAWTMQLATVFTVTCAVAGLWRQECSHALRASALCAAALLVTPYVYMYDFPLLTISVAFLYRNGGFDRVDLTSIALANLLILAYAFGVCVAPVGPMAVILICGLIARRLLPSSDKSSVPQIEVDARPGQNLQERHAHV